MRLLWMILLLLGGLLAFGRFSRPAATPVAAESAARRPATPVAETPPTPQPRVVPVAVDSDLGTRTPVIDRLARAEARRRIAWAGKAVFLDSALATTDSVLRRWTDRPEVRIAVLPLPENPSLATEVRAAVREWRLLDLGMVLTDVADTSVADIVVHWIEKFDLETHPGSGDSAARTGLTEVQTTRRGEIERATVTLATAAVRGRRLTPLEVRAVAMHELGHALGLPHSGDSGDVMYPTVSRPVLSGRDRATATLLYALPPGSLREPATP